MSIDGDVLTVRRGGGAAQRFDLGSSSDVEVTRHQWHMDDGTAVKIQGGNHGVCIGGRGAFFPDFPYERAVVDRPDLVMACPAFEELHTALVRAGSQIGFDPPEPVHGLNGRAGGSFASRHASGGLLLYIAQKEGSPCTDA